MLFDENTKNILLNGSEQEIKEHIMTLGRSQPDSSAYKVAVDFLLFKYQENLVNKSHGLVNKTHGLVVATWVLAILNGLLVVISFYKSCN